MPDARPAFQFADLRQQQETAQLGIWTFLATEVLFFGGLLLAYAVYRTTYPADFAEAARHTKIIIGAANTAILLTSSFAVAWAVAAARSNQSTAAGTLAWAAAALGAVFIALKGYEYFLEYGEHLVPGVNFEFAAAAEGPAELFFIFYFTATALHGLHVIIGVIALIVIGKRAKEGAYSASYNAPITVAGLYWHFVDTVWVILFALIYLPGRSLT